MKRHRGEASISGQLRSFNSVGTHLVFNEVMCSKVEVEGGMFADSVELVTNDVVEA